MKALTTFSTLLEAFFVERLMQQRRVSSHTIASYRDTFRLLLQFTQKRLHKAPSSLAISDLTAAFVGEFLDYLEKDRRNTARSRNVRLAAIRSFFRYVARQAPEYSGVAGRVLDLPSKRYVRRPIRFLTQYEVDALLAAPDLSTWCGRRGAPRSGTSCPSLSGHPAWLRGPRMVRGEGTQRTLHASRERYRCRVTRLVEGASR